MNKLLMTTALALVVITTSFAASAAGGGGQEACGIVLQHVRSDVNSKVSTVPPTVMQSLQQKLEVADTKCAEGGYSATQDAANIRQSIKDY